MEPHARVHNDKGVESEPAPNKNESVADLMVDSSGEGVGG